MSKNNILIIGGDGFIGKALAKKLKEQQDTVYTTTRHYDSISEKNLYLDFSQDITDFIIPEGVDLAFICAAKTNIVECEKNPEIAHKINTLNPIYLAEKLLEKGIFVVFLSTSAVFDGSKPYFKAEESPCPKTTYGKTKAEVEAYLKKHPEHTLIVRPTKVLSHETPLIKSWLSALSTGKEITPFIDLSIAPIHLDYLVDALIVAGKSKKGGVLQVSGSEDITYEEFARSLAHAIGKSDILIRGVCSKDSAVKVVHRHDFSSLDPSESERKYNISSQMKGDIIYRIQSKNLIGGK